MCSSNSAGKITKAYYSTCVAVADLVLVTLFSVSQSGGWIPCPPPDIAFSPRVKAPESGRGGVGGGLGSPLAGFSPNTKISFLMISPNVLDICPVLLLGQLT